MSDTAALTQAYATARAGLMARPGVPGPGRRHELVRLTDGWLADLFAASGASGLGAALVAVGGYGRQELAPGSDLDLVLVVPADADAAAAADAADRLWYPVWDSGVRLDHAVRRPAEVARVAASDLRAAVGLLDLRLVAGESGLAASVRDQVRADWRARGGRRLGELRESCEERAEAQGELAHLLEPDLKEAHGGLRDATVLRAVAASWVTDVTHVGVSEATTSLLDVRDALHLATGRTTDRLNMQDHAAVAERLAGGGRPDDELLRGVAAAGRVIAYAMDLTWHRVERSSPSRRRLVPSFGGRRVPARAPLAEGVVEQDGEVVLARDSRPGADPVLVLRTAAAAAQAGLRLAPLTVARLAVETAPMPRPWPSSARDALVSLLGAGHAAVPVWEALDQAGLIERLVPEWSAVRSKPQRNPVHRFTVDRHLVEAAVQAAAFTRQVARPDLLLVGALLHDIGKGFPGDHTEVGIELVGRIGASLGFPDDDIRVLADLVRHHLLLPETATRRDLDDPATTELVAAAVGESEFLDLLHALTEADARATGPAAWTPWRAGLVADLVRRTHAVLRGAPPAAPPSLSSDQLALADAGELAVRLDESDDVVEVTVAAPDSVGQLATVAGVLSVHRLLVRSATTQTVGDWAVSSWRVEPEFGDPPTAERLRADLRRAVSGSLDVAGRLAAREAAYDTRPEIRVAAPRVDVVEGASSSATVIEVRAHDTPRLLHRIATALAAVGVDIRSARVSTLGSEAVDVFYVVDAGGAPLAAGHAADVAEKVRAALG